MNNYASLKVAELKALLKDRSLAQSGRKSDLITRLEEADSKVDGTEDNQAAVGPADEEHAVQAADAEQPQQHKENGDLDGADDMPTAANGEENARQVDDVPADASAPEEGAAGTGTAEEAQEVGVLQNDQVKTGSVDAGAAAAVPQEGENLSPGNGDMMDAEQGTGQQPAPLDPEPAPADPQPTSGAPPAETHEEDAAPIAKGDEAPPAAPAEGGDKASEQPDESDSLGLDDSDLDQHEAKADTQTAADSGPSKQPSAPEPGDKPSASGDPPAKTDAMSTDAAPAKRHRSRPGDEPDTAAPSAPAAKRKHAAIVFPDASTQADRPAPKKREKVELVVPEATDETCALCISGLKRPLREGELKEILSKTGTIEGFWIDSCKTHCYVLYGSVEEATATRDAVDGLQWPPRCRSVMRPKYVAVEEARGMIDSKGAATLTRVPSTSGPGGADARGGDAEAADKDDAEAPGDAAEEPVIDLTKAPPRVPRRDASQVAAGGSAPPELAPSELFNLTEATPSLYWLPLSEEQVEQRRSVDAARRVRAAAAAAGSDVGDDAAAGDAEKAAAGSPADEQGDDAVGGAAEDAAPPVDKVPDEDVEMADPDEEEGAKEA